MRLPESMPARRQSGTIAKKAGADAKDGLAPAGCCIQICTPLGCRCLLDLPVCP
jgi:hypothetical protein